MLFMSDDDVGGLESIAFCVQCFVEAEKSKIKKMVTNKETEHSLCPYISTP